MKHGLQIAALGAGSAAVVAVGVAVFSHESWPAPIHALRTLGSFGTVRTMRPDDVGAMKALWLRCTPGDASTTEAEALALMVQNCMAARSLSDEDVNRVLVEGEKKGSLILEDKGQIRGFALIGATLDTDRGRLAYVHVIFLDVAHFGQDLPAVYKRFAIALVNELGSRGFDGLKTITPVRLGQIPGYHADLDGLGIWEQPHVMMGEQVKSWTYTVWFKEMVPVLTLEQAKDEAQRE